MPLTQEAVTSDSEERKWRAPDGVSSSLYDDADSFACPETFLSLTGQVPSRTLGSWRYRRFGAI